MKPQKALHLFQESDKKNPKYIDNNYAIFEKYDGWYGYMDSDDGVIMSRQCREIPSLQDLSKDISLPFEGRMIFEILVKEVPDFHTMNGILNRTKGDCQAKGAYIVVHDYIPDFNCNIPFYERYSAASDAVRSIGHGMVAMAPILESSNKPEVWQAFAESVWLSGGEGVVLKKTNAIYSPDKRNADLMKIKEEVTLDLLVVGMERGEGKYSDTLGSLIVKSKDGIKHSISGMTDVDRIFWWVDPDCILGKVVEVKAMKKLKDGTLREPRYKAIRFDKTSNDID